MPRRARYPTRERADGRHEVRLSLGGKRRSVYGRTPDDAQRAAEALERKWQRGQLSSTRTRLGEYLDWWLEHVVAVGRSPGTLCTYQRHVKNYLRPRLGHLRLADLTPAHVQEMHSQLITKQRLSPLTVRLTHDILHAALEYAAESLELIPRNPVKRARRPAQQQPRVPPVLDAQAALKFLHSVAGDPLEPLWWVWLCTGLRIGEIARLRWEDVDLGNHTLRIPVGKTHGSRRLAPLVAPAAAQLTRHWRSVCCSSPIHEQQTLVQRPVFEDRPEAPVNTNTLRLRWRRALARAGLPYMRPHDIRHTTASLLFALGVHPKHVQELLGHSSIKITMDIYSHMVPPAYRAEIEKLGTLLSEGKAGDDEDGPALDPAGSS